MWPGACAIRAHALGTSCVRVRVQQRAEDLAVNHGLQAGEAGEQHHQRAVRSRLGAKAGKGGRVLGGGGQAVPILTVHSHGHDRGVHAACAC